MAFNQKSPFDDLGYPRVVLLSDLYGAAAAECVSGPWRAIDSSPLSKRIICVSCVLFSFKWIHEGERRVWFVVVLLPHSAKGFQHHRMTNGAMNVEIGNPAYKIYEGEPDDDAGELLDSDFALDPDKVKHTLVPRSCLCGNVHGGM